jgi:hypothetical protein
MKRILTILLVIVAIPLWVWNSYVIISAIVKSPKDKTVISAIATMPVQAASNAIPATFTVKGKSPFVAYKELPKPAITAIQPKKNTVNTAPVNTAPVRPLDVSVNGIMWNTNNPLAMLKLPDGSSTVAKQGQELSGGILVKTIEKNQVEIVFNGQSFWLKK